MMKSSFVLTLFALCLTAGAAELRHFGNALSFPKYTSVLTAALDRKYGRVLNSDPADNTSYPYLRIDYGYRRTGVVTVSHYGISVERCIQRCRKNNHSCLAVNYEHYTWTCHELETLGVVASHGSYSTCLVNYKNGADICDESYFLKSYVRNGFFYEVFRGTKAPSAKDCCVKCREDPQSRCAIWSYDASNKICHLQEVASTLRTYSIYITGFGVVRSASL